MRFYAIRGTSNYCAKIGFRASWKLIVQSKRNEKFVVSKVNILLWQGIKTGTIGQTPAYTSLKIFRLRMIQKKVFRVKYFKNIVIINPYHTIFLSIVTGCVTSANFVIQNQRMNFNTIGIKPESYN